MNDEMKVYQEIMDDICNRTNGEYEKMSYTDKLMTISIMKIIKEQMDRYMKEQYPIVCAWSAIPIESIILNETEPDFTRFRNNGENNFYKLMGGRL